MAGKRARCIFFLITDAGTPVSCLNYSNIYCADLSLASLSCYRKQKHRSSEMLGGSKSFNLLSGLIVIAEMVSVARGLFADPINHKLKPDKTFIVIISCRL